MPLKIATAIEMKEIDRAAIEENGISANILMERAGLAVSLKVKDLYYGKKIVVLCGSGNNGGDGLAAARNLHNWGFKVNVLILAKKNSLSPDSNAQYHMANKAGVTVEFRDSINERDIHGGVVVDAVFGTGLSRHVKGGIAAAFHFINDSGVPVISVDIPSGISSDTGEIMGEAVMADYTVTFGLPKRGHFLHPGAEYTGKLFVEDIGFPNKLLCSEKIPVSLIQSSTIRELIPERRAYSHKGDYGHIFLVAGSKGKTGAALLAAKACLRSGAGLVTLGVPESLTDIFQCRVTEEMTMSLPDDSGGMLAAEALDRILNFANQKADVLAIGPGIGISGSTEKIISGIIRHSAVPVIIDADGLNSIAGNVNILKKARSPIILTPHPGEMKRLLSQKPRIDMETGKPPEFSQNDRITTAMKFAQETETYLVLKGVPTVIAVPGKKAFINITGNPGMATAGSGDVLTGIIASLIGQGLNPLEASLLGVYIHGSAGDIAAAKKGAHSLIASDITESLPDAFKEIIYGKSDIS